MTLPDIDSLATAGGALLDYAPVIDPTTDRSAAGANVGYADATAATRTITRAWAQFTPAGTGAPTLVAHNSVWGNALAVAPTPARTSVGLYTMAWPVTVNDDIPINMPGYSSPHTLNLRDGWCNFGGSTPFFVNVTITAANVATIRIWSSAGSLTDPSGPSFGVYVL